MEELTLLLHTLRPRLLTRQGASLEEGNLKSRTDFASQSKILTREPRILGRIHCRAKCFSLPQQTSRAGDQESIFPCCHPFPSNQPNLPPLLVLGRNECPASAAAQPSAVAVWQGSTAVHFAPEILNTLSSLPLSSVGLRLAPGVKKTSGTARRRNRFVQTGVGGVE